ncbi:Gfo/Idh/MocA family protein [Granulicella arctica]|uniref:Putative dehydrogenase n=1 Tax=Granulicella arctica TaxID=940613 RepID=A0A7Y9PE79_9BACT|nr:Gfo/Idh/MocA family oxidoreductase [Granulicella arctica]NYF78059.1 putative dehydrogenase [Granulicella arctica]
MISRRTFLDGIAIGVAGAAISSTAKSYGQILGSNERLNFAIIGLNGRGYAHLSGLKGNSTAARVSHVCDVDAKILAKFSAEAEKELGYAPVADGDFRKVLESKDVDVITIATPDHWHAPMALLGLQAGKHVYVEKPSSHNPREGEILVAAQKKYGKLVQVGDQQRSSPHTIKIIGQIHDGLIGRAYYGKAWYVNTRKSMGIGKPAPVPEWFNWDLWQGPAPRSEYKDNIHPYNWHWLRRYGTGESLNNGTHEVDICRWALAAEYPQRVTASGGRYQYKDDWQFYDTLNTSFEYPDQMISWEGRSCQGMKLYGRDRGVTILGTKGSVLIDRDGYEVYDWDGKKTDEFKTGKQTSSSDLLGRDSMTDLHFGNLIAGIRSGEPLHSPIVVANVSVTMLQLSNIAYFVNRELKLDTATGHIQSDSEAMTMWDRKYEKGWEMRI